MAQATRRRRDGRTIYVPAEGSHLRRLLAPGSGIVGTVLGDGRVLIDYEGRVYRQANMETYADRVYHAHDRHVWRGRGYPTTARAVVDADELVEVGTLTPRELQGIPDEPRIDLHITRQDLVDDWCGTTEGGTP